MHTNAQLKDLYDSRPELKELLQQRAKLHEDEQKSLEDQKADVFVAGPTVSVSAKYLIKEKVLVTINLPPKMIQKLTFEFSSVRSGTTHVLAKHNGRAVFLFQLRLEELLDMQQRCAMCSPIRLHSILSSTFNLCHFKIWPLCHFSCLCCMSALRCPMPCPASPQAGVCARRR